MRRGLAICAAALTVACSSAASIQDPFASGLGESSASDTGNMSADGLDTWSSVSATQGASAEDGSSGDTAGVADDTTGGPTGGGGSTTDGVDDGDSDSTSDSDSDSTGGSAGLGSTGAASESDSTGPCTSGSASVLPSEVLECGMGYLDEDDHPVGSGYSIVADDLRTGTCSPTACVSGGETVYGMDLEFDLPVPMCAQIESASLVIRGIPNNGDPGTTTIYDMDTDAMIGSCTIDQPSQSYGECTADLDASYLEAGVTQIYTESNNPNCYFVYDFVQLDVTW